MKLSGAKNTGAWYRANKALVNLTALEQTAFQTAFSNISEYLDPTYDDIVALAAETGVDVGLDIPSTSQLWLTKMVHQGIPLQIWMGHLSFTTYTLSGSPGARKATANYQSNVGHFAKELRKAVRKYIFADREVRDLLNIGTRPEGNPGGLPDTDPLT